MARQRSRGLALTCRMASTAGRESIRCRWGPYKTYKRVCRLADEARRLSVGLRGQPEDEVVGEQTTADLRANDRLAAPRHPVAFSYCAKWPVFLKKRAVLGSPLQP